MNTSLRSLATLLLFSLSSILFAQHVSINKAIGIAENHLLIATGGKYKSVGVKNTGPQVLPVLLSGSNTDTLMFILNDTQNKSFVIIAADERFWPVIGYSLNGTFNEKNQPPAFVEWLENRKREIENVRKNNIQPEPRVIQQWKYLSSQDSKSATALTEVTPLLITTWSQGCNYNALCPPDASGPCGHVQTGCVATSMAQIMKYWSYPATGAGSKTYTHSKYGNLTADFGSTNYLWSQMPVNVTTANDAVALLMFHCGVSVNMNYGPDVSGAGDPINAFINYFRYSPEAEFVLRNSYTATEWADLLKAELDLNRPVWYRGNSPESGHAWICDGYQGSDYFHFNWGWGGSQDGYFYLDNLNYNTDHAAITKLFPSVLPDGYQGFFLSAINLNIAGNGGTVSTTIASSANWTVTSDQPWLTVNPGAGLPGTSTINFTATENNTGAVRSATATVSVNGYGSRMIRISQGTNVYISHFSSSPGLLHDDLLNKLSTLTNLTISGSIDARDFKTIRDEMPLLSELNLSNVTIAAYTGTGGTMGIGANLYAYPVNVLPPYAFFNNNTYLGKTSLIKIVLPETITVIGSRAFEGCHGLKTVTIPGSVTTIDGLAFFGCMGITSIYISKSVTTIGKQAFSNNSALLTVDPENLYFSSRDGVLFDKFQYKLIYCPIVKSGSYTIPSTVRSIEVSAFAGCSGLTSVTIPTSVTSIGEIAFYNCMGLTSITIPWSVTTIGERAFWYNNALINVDESNLIFSSYDGALFNKTKTKLIQCSFAKSGFIIPSTVTEIGACSFENCTRLTSVTIPSSVKTIGEKAFWSTCNLPDLYIPASVTSIGEFAFFSYGTYSGGKLVVDNGNPNYSAVDGVLFDKEKTKIIMFPDYKSGMYEIPSTVKTIVNRAFMGCYALTSVIIPSSVEVIGYEAFSRCSGLQSIVARPQLPVVLSSSLYSGAYKVFDGVNKSTCTLYVPYITKALYSASAQWKDFTNIVEAPEGFRPATKSVSLGSGAGSIATVDLKANIYWTAISDQPWLTVTPASGTGDALLKFTASLNTTSADRTAKVTISAEGFESQEIFITQSAKVAVTAGGLHNAYVEVLNTVTSIEITGTIDARDFKTMRDEMTLLSNIDIGDAIIVGYTGTGGTDFRVSSTAYPANTIPDFAFVNTSYNGKPSLISIKLPESLVSIGMYSFRLCTGLTSITIPSSVTSINDGAFNLCYALKAATIPASMTSIGNFAFYGCTDLNKIYAFPSTPVNLSTSSTVFGDVNKSTCTLYVPYGATSLYSSANQWKDFLNIIEIPGFLLSSKALTISNEENSSASVEIISYTSWNVNSDQSWLTVSPSTSVGSGIITFIASVNQTGEIRTAAVTISASGVASQTIIVNQQGLTVGIDLIPKNSYHFDCYPNPFSEEINIRIQNPDKIRLAAAIYNLSGQKIKDLISEITEDQISLIWNGTTESGQAVKPGVYLFKINNQSRLIIYKGR